METETLIVPALPAKPFKASDLPLIAKLARAAHHRYAKRWNKRLCKKPVRLAYDFAQDVLKLGGQGVVTLSTASGDHQARFDARHPHFGSLYFENEVSGYEPDVSALLSSLLRDNRTFFDIGANWGYFTFYAAALAGYEGAIHSFEPAPVTRADLEGLRGGFGLQKRITVHGVALSSQSGTAEMAIHDKETGLNRIAGSGVGREGTGRVEVPMQRLDDLDIRPDVIKMDVEDHEYEALSGAAGVLGESKPHIVVESWLTPDKPVRTMRALRLLENAGYVLYQPAWRIDTNDGPVVFPEKGSRTPGETCRLVIVPFASEQRFMLSQQMNVFACHRDRVADLKADRFTVLETG